MYRPLKIKIHEFLEIFNKIEELGKFSIKIHKNVEVEKKVKK